MSDQVIKILEYMGEKIGVAIDWTQENVLPYAEDLVRRFITYNIVECALCILCFILCGVTAAILVKVISDGINKAKATRKDNWIAIAYSYGDVEPNVGGVFLIVATGICILACAVGIPCMIGELIKWCIIPEFKIVEELSHLISGTV